MRIDLLIEQLQLRFLLLDLHLVFVHDQAVEPAGHIIGGSDQHTDLIIAASPGSLGNAVARLILAHKKASFCKGVISERQK